MSKIRKHVRVEDIITSGAYNTLLDVQVAMCPLSFLFFLARGVAME